MSTGFCGRPRAEPQNRDAFVPLTAGHKPGLKEAGRLTLVGRYDGRLIELICDGRVMARKAGNVGRLTQNAEPGGGLEDCWS